MIRQLVSQETFTDKKGVNRNIRFEECTGRVRQLEYLSPEGDDEYFNVSLSPRKKRRLISSRGTAIQLWSYRCECTCRSNG